MSGTLILSVPSNLEIQRKENQPHLMAISFDLSHTFGTILILRVNENRQSLKNNSCSSGHETLACPKLNLSHLCKIRSHTVTC